MSILNDMLDEIATLLLGQIGLRSQFPANAILVSRVLAEAGITGVSLPLAIPAFSCAASVEGPSWVIPKSWKFREPFPHCRKVLALQPKSIGLPPTSVCN